MNTVKRNGVKKMSKNIIPQIAEILGVEIGEEFKVDIANENEIFRISEKGIEYRYSGGYAEKLCPNWVSANRSFYKFLTGEAKIIRLPFLPKQDETYWTFYRSPNSNKWVVTSTTWTDSVADRAKRKVGWCYRTEKRAKFALSEVAWEQGVGYEFI